MILIGFARRPLRTRAGDRLLEQLRAQHLGLKRGARMLSSSDLALAVGLFGMSALAGTELSSLEKTFQPPPSAGSDASGCGSGCGGGD